MYLITEFTIQKYNPLVSRCYIVFMILPPQILRHERKNRYTLFAKCNYMGR